MRKICQIFRYSLLSAIIFCCNSREPSGPSPVQIKKIDYPSASAIEFYHDKLYIIGDDAVNILVLDANLNTIDSIPLFSFPGKRIPKDIKPDLEASAVARDGNLYLFGSGSSAQRNAAWKYDPGNRTTDSISLEALYAWIKNSGVEQINIEGACQIRGKLVLVNRGNKGYQHNQLIIIDEKILTGDSSYSVQILPFDAQEDTTGFKGVSGLAYAIQNDQLLMTVSTEDTRNAYDDGAIGKSYLWIISSISDRLSQKKIRADKIIDLEATDPRFKGQKIESLTILNGTKDQQLLALVADNDDGSSTLFKISISKN